MGDGLTGYLDSVPKGSGDRCVVCGTKPAPNKYKGKRYCDDDYQQRMAMETGAGY